MAENKFNRRHLAVGHWGSPWRLVQATQTPDKIRVMLQDKLITRGRWVELYLPVASTYPGAVACTCTKDTTSSADYACLTCHGTQFAPGYLKFLHETQFWCSAEVASFTMTGVEVMATKKGRMLQLTAGALTGSIVTQDKPYDNTAGLPYEVKLEAYRRFTGSTLTLEASTNGGTSWAPLTLSEVPSPGYGFTATIPANLLPATGNVRFRITMTRLSAGDLTPVFEVLRIRRPLTEHSNLEIQRVRPDFQAGRILILRPWVTEQQTIDPGRGRSIEHANDRTWTMPLDFFHRALTPETMACRVDYTKGPHPFYTFSSGVQADSRYVMTNIQYNDQFGVFTHQFFSDRFAAAGETYMFVW